MPRFVAFLRAINVGGHVVKMDTLRGQFEAMGFGAVETFIASGNVIFDGGARDAGKLEARIEKGLEAALGYEVVTFLRTPAELAATVAHGSFPDDRLAAARALNVAFLKEPLDAAGERALAALRTEVDDFHVHGREVWWLCEARQSESKFSNVRFEKLLGRRATFRGIGTVRKLAAKYPA
jgi:uncharacterized protein (DUF1697 family)